MADYSKINLDHTINSGQVFLWKRTDEFWYGINGQDVLRIDTKSNAIKSANNNNFDFLRKNDNLEEIIKSISHDKIVRVAVKNYLGLRILRQDPFQCLISFIVSANSNIQNIKKNLENICKKFGARTKLDNQEFFTFPVPKTLATATINDIKSCGTGYRAKFIKEAAIKIASKQINLDHLKKSDYLEAKNIIKQVPGVGNKVADCVLLFSLDKLDAFPLDRWMLRILQENYFDEFEIKTRTITEKQYDILHDVIVKHFGKFAGYAQQFLFKTERDVHQKKWL